MIHCLTRSPTGCRPYSAYRIVRDGSVHDCQVVQQSFGISQIGS
jgi:hypothetical protein